MTYFKYSQAKRERATPDINFNRISSEEYARFLSQSIHHAHYAMWAHDTLPKIEALLEEAVSALVMIKHGSIVGYLTGEGCRLRAGCSLNKIEKELQKLVGET